MTLSVCVNYVQNKSQAATLVLMITMMLGGCAAAVPQLSEQGRQVKVYKKDPVQSCAEIGPIEAVHGKGACSLGEKGSYQGAYLLLKNDAAKMGGNYVRLDSHLPPHDNQDRCFDNRFIIYGVVFRCQ